MYIYIYVCICTCCCPRVVTVQVADYESVERTVFETGKWKRLVIDEPQDLRFLEGLWLAVHRRTPDQGVQAVRQENE